MSKPFVLVNLDKPRKLRYTTNALVMLEESLGKPIGEIMNDFANGLYGFKDIRNLLWAGLLDEDSSLTPEDAGNLLDEAEDFAEVVTKIGEALQESFGTQQKKVEKKQTAKESNGTGTKHSE